MGAKLTVVWSALMGHTAGAAAAWLRLRALAEPNSARASSRTAEVALEKDFIVASVTLTEAGDIAR